MHSSTFEKSVPRFSHCTGMCICVPCLLVKLVHHCFSHNWVCGTDKLTHGTRFFLLNQHPWKYSLRTCVAVTLFASSVFPLVSVTRERTGSWLCLGFHCFLLFHLYIVYASNSESVVLNGIAIAKDSISVHLCTPQKMWWFKIIKAVLVDGLS